jgi:biotin carboxylase
MNDSPPRRVNLICVASFFKGNEFLRECRRLGARVVLLTRPKLLGEDWARDALEEVLAVADPEGGADAYCEAAEQVARCLRVASVVALEEYDVVTAARVREQLCLSGMGTTAARHFHDKLAMRRAAQAAGMRGPEFVHLLNAAEVAEFLGRVAPPWVLKPRSGASAMGVRKLETAEEVWRTAAELDARAEPRERAPAHLLERYVRGDVYHVDSLVAGGRLRFACASRYGAPPFDVAHAGGVSTSHTLRHGSAEERRLLAANRRLLSGLRLERGVAHAEFIRAAADGQFYFLEVAARVGGAHTAELVEAATGVNLWREWARIEVAGEHGRYELPPVREDYAGIVISLARQEWPDTSDYDDPEIVFRLRKRHHVGLLVASHDPGRVDDLLDSYVRRFLRDFNATLPAADKATS